MSTMPRPDTFHASLPEVDMTDIDERQLSTPRIMTILAVSGSLFWGSLGALVYSMAAG